VGLLLAGGLAPAAVDFNKDIRPILEKTCLKCHGPVKPRAKLRLDSKAGLLKGSTTGKVVEPGHPEKSMLYQLVIKPKDDPERMPSMGEPLTKAQTNLIRDWIKEGLPWPEGLVLKGPPEKPEVPAGGGVGEKGLPITPAEKAAVAKLEKAGVLVLRLAQNTNWLRVDFSLGDGKVKEADLALLKDMPNLVELNLGGTDVTDARLTHLKALPNLTILKLHRTKITDAGLVHLKGLTKLTSLNLYGTAVTDKGLEHLKGLKALRKLYLWDSKATAAGAKVLAAAIPGIDVNLGEELKPVAVKPVVKPEPKPTPKPAAKDPRVFELRIYYAAPGKLDALNARFRNHTTKLFEKHGMTNIGYWVPVDNPENKLIYLLAFPSVAAQQASWKAFLADPAWQKVYKESEAGGKLVARIEPLLLSATDYSPAIKPGKAPAERVFELRVYTTPPGKLDALNARFRDHTVKLFEKHGMTNIGYWVPLAGQKGAGTTLVYLLAHKSVDAAKASFEAFRKDPAWTKALKESEAKAGGPLTVKDGVKSTFVKPTDYSPLR
jgi:hypothetical protein